MRKSPIYYIIIWGALIGSLILLVKLSPALYKSEYILADDFGHFWASGKAFISGNNPYDLEKLISIQIQAGANQSSYAGIGSQTLNPPWSMIVFAPFSLLNYSAARLLWLIINITVLIISTRQLWVAFNYSKSKYWLALLVTLTFTPVYSVLSKGQVTLWIVLAISGLLLYFEGRGNICWVGICIVLATIKPQLFYLIWPALGLWVISRRSWRLFFSGGILGLAVILMTLLFNDKIYIQYFNAIREYPYDQWATPTIGSYLRLFWLGVDKFWVQYLPASLGFAWFINFYWKHRDNWSWKNNIPIMTLVSLLTSPYAWTYDAVIILPAILVASGWLISQDKPSKYFFWVILLGINITNLLLHTRLNEFWFLWLAPAYLLWFLAVKFVYRPQER